MSESMRNILVVFLVLAMAVAAFSAGFVTHNFITDSRAAAAAGGDFSLLQEAWSYVDATYLGDQ
ncbi:MAG: hypothetical protein RRC07_08225, partial [Anaerolineae bacterium]|nr:hypothetical protein [Anaerolineae bacterium]